MTVEEIVNYNFGLEELWTIEECLEMIVEIDENISVKKLLEIIKKPIDKQPKVCYNSYRKREKGRKNYEENECNNQL